MNLRRVCDLTSKCVRHFHTTSSRQNNAYFNMDRAKSTLNYCTAVGLLVFAGSYAAVPMYRIFCQKTSYGGTVKHDIEGKIENVKPVKDRPIRVTFQSDKSAELDWEFQPQQTSVKLVPGETALIFYTAMNPSDQPVSGVSSYNVIPFEAGKYFNKIQCFCFEEQQLNPHEEVDMPVFFYIDPEFAEDPYMDGIDEITLSYTFYPAKKLGFEIPVPNYLKQHFKKEQ